ncbi:MAG: hypothetical protein AAGA10_10060, partial [Bacteroidota bacterium]
MARNYTLEKARPVAPEEVEEGIVVRANGKYQYTIDKFPFNSRLCFEELIKDWDRKRREKVCEADRILADRLFELLEDAPEFLGPIDDLSILDKHKEIIDIFLSGLVPTSRRDTQLAVVSNPFNPNGFYKTPAFEEMYQKKQAGLMLSKEPEQLKSFMIIRPSIEVLNKFYKQDIHIDLPTIFTIQNPHSDLEKHYKSQLDLNYVDIKALKPPKKLSPTQINELLTNINDLELWQKYIPPENFEFRGVVVMNLIDITDEEAISRVKDILLEKDAVVDRSRLLHIQHHMRTLFKISDLRLGITAIDCNNRQSSLYPDHLANSLLSGTNFKLLDKKYSGSAYCRMCTYKEAVLIEDIKKESWKTPL